MLTAITTSLILTALAKQPMPRDLAPSEAERLADVTRYLTDAEAELQKLFGRKPGEKPDAELKTLWARTRVIWTDYAGEGVAKKRMDELKPTVGNLENVTFALMREIFGPKWYERYLKNPTRQ